MIKQSRKTNPVYLSMDMFFISISFFVPYIIRYNNLHEFSNNIQLPNFREHCFVFALEVVFLIISFKQKRLYTTDRNLSIPKELQRVITYILYANIIIGSIIFFAQYKFFSRFVFILNFVLLCTLLGGWRTVKRLLVRKLIREGFHNINVLIVGAGRTRPLVLEEIRRLSHLGLKVVGILSSEKEPVVDGIPVLGDFADFIDVAQNHFIDEIIITISSEKKGVSELITQAQSIQLGVKMVPEHLEQSIPIIDVGYLGIVPLLTYKEQKIHPSRAAIKRLLDVAGSSISIVLLSPALLLITILIRITSPGSAIFVQQRVGFKGKIFNLYKFRSMIKNAEKQKEQLLSKNEMKDGIMFKIRKDPRITKIGRFLRKYSLDELPQFFNVLKGEMSLVGPRPPLYDEVEKYKSYQMNRLSIRPGMTGLSQIRGRSCLAFSRWVKWDLWYINNWTFLLDIRIILWTVPAVIKGKGAW